MALLLLARPAAVGAAGPAAESSSAELLRYRITNQAGGAVELSTDGGESWIKVGKVTHAAQAAAVAPGLITVAKPASVAGVGPGRLLLRLPSIKAQHRQLSIVARGAAETAATITVDLPASGPLFRSLAPVVGSRVLLEKGGVAGLLPAAYLPRPDDRLVLVAPRFEDPEPPSITIENKEGGEVIYAVTGGIPQIVARVKQPLRGIGRYAGTERAGTGSVLTWSPTLALIATAARKHRTSAGEEEERGGFIIQPAEPGLKGVSHPASQMLVQTVSEGAGRPPVSALFGLPVPLTSGDPFDAAPTRIEVRIDDGDWEPLPDLRGTINADQMPKALAEAAGGGRTVTTGITHLRIFLGNPSPANLERRMHLAALPLEESPQRGAVKIRASIKGDGIEYVSFLLNGIQQKLTNIAPYQWDWDTSRIPNGEHLVEIRGLDKKGNMVSTTIRKVLVDN